MVNGVSATAWLGRGCAVWAAAVLGCTTPPGNPGTSSTGEGTTGASDTAETGITSGGPGIQTVTSLPQTSTGEMSTGSSTTEEPVDCAGAVGGLGAMLAAGEPCDVLVHLDEADVVLEYHIACGTVGPGWTSGKEMLAATMCCVEAASVYAPDSDMGPYYVPHFVDPMGPDGVAIVSNHRGAVVLDARTATDMPGPIAVPAPWSDATDLVAGQGCGGAFDLGGAASHDLDQDGAAIGDLSGVAAAIAGTALAPALEASATPVRTVVVRYAPQDKGAPHTFVLIEVTGK